MPKERPADVADAVHGHEAGGSLTERPNAVVRRDLARPTAAAAARFSFRDAPQPARHHALTPPRGRLKASPPRNRLALISPTPSPPSLESVPRWQATVRVLRRCGAVLLHRHGRAGRKLSAQLREPESRVQLCVAVRGCMQHCSSQSPRGALAPRCRSRAGEVPDAVRRTARLKRIPSVLPRLVAPQRSSFTGKPDGSRVQATAVYEVPSPGSREPRPRIERQQSALSRHDKEVLAKFSLGALGVQGCSRSRVSDLHPKEGFGVRRPGSGSPLLRREASPGY